MSNIIKELQILKDKRRRGLLSQDQFDAAKNDLFNNIPEVLSNKKDSPAPKAPKALNPLWDTLFFWLSAAFLCGALTWAITGSAGLGSTLGVTILAAFTIRLYNSLK